MRWPSRPNRPAGFDAWTPARFLIAQATGAEAIDGYELEGLGLALLSRVTARYRRRDGTRRVDETWSVYHLNTGHMVRSFRQANARDAFTWATSLVALTDWTFEGLDGWRNRDPQVPDKLEEWHKALGLKGRFGGMGRMDAIAREIGASRW